MSGGRDIFCPTFSLGAFYSRISYAQIFAFYICLGLSSTCTGTLCFDLKLDFGITQLFYFETQTELTRRTMSALWFILFIAADALKKSPDFWREIGRFWQFPRNREKTPKIGVAGRPDDDDRGWPG